MCEYYDSAETGHDQAYIVDDWSRSIVLGHSDCISLKCYFNLCTLILKKAEMLTERCVQCPCYCTIRSIKNFRHWKASCKPSISQHMKHLADQQPFVQSTESALDLQFSVRVSQVGKKSICYLIFVAIVCHKLIQFMAEPLHCLCDVLSMDNFVGSIVQY